MKQSCRDVLGLLRTYPEGITALEALNDVGCFRLGARIYDLKAEGYRIETDLVTTMTGKRIARYRLVEKPRQMALGFAIQSAQVGEKVPA